MRLEFDDRQYINVDEIQVLRWIVPSPEVGEPYGLCVCGGQKIGLDEEQFKVMEQAFKWNASKLYKPDQMPKGE